MKDAGFGMSHDHFAESWEAAFQRQAQRFSAQQREFRMLDVARDFCSGLLPSPDERWPEKLAATFIDDWASQVTPVTGAAGLVQRLSKHYRVGLISNTHYPPMVYSLLDTMSLSSVFEVVSLSVEVGVPKPDPGIFEQTLAKLRIEPADAIYIGDNYEHDFLGARSIGMDCYLIGKHARVPLDRQLRNIHDLAIYFETARK